MADVTITRSGDNVVAVTASRGTIVTRGSVAPLASDPVAPYDGQVWFNTTSNELKYYDGSSTIVVGTADQAANADRLDGEHGTYYLARSNHTGSQAIATIAGLQAALDDKASTASLAGKSNLGHAHTQADIANFATAVDARITKTKIDSLDVDADTLDGQDSTAFATAAQGAKADTASQPGHDHDVDYAAIVHDHDGDYETTGTSAAAAASAVSTHEAAGDPHAGYQRESEKGQTSGYASLDGTTRVPAAQLGSGTADDTTYLRGDGSWQPPPDGGGGGVTDHGSLTGNADDDHTLYALADGSRGNFAAPGHDHDAAYDPAGTAAVSTSTHEAAGDPHPGYLLESALTKAAVDALNVDADTVDGADSADLRARATHTGTQTASTISDFSTQVQTLIDTAVDALLDGAPAALDTLNELAAAIGDDADFAATITAALATKLDSAAHTKAAHDALDVDAGTVDGYNAADLLDRANHLGAQTISTVTGLQAALDGKEDDGTSTAAAAAAVAAHEAAADPHDGYVLADGSRALSGALNAAGNLLTNVGDPIADQDAATKAYVDTEIAGIEAIAALDGGAADSTYTTSIDGGSA